MILHIERARPRRGRRIAIGLGGAVSMVALLALHEGLLPAAPRASASPVAPVAPVASIGLPPGIAQSDRAIAAAPMHAEPRIAKSMPADAARPSPPTQPFRFLGKVTAEGVTSVVLYGGGRTLTVSAAGPLDADYAVDAIEEDYLVLREVQRGVSQILALDARHAAPVAAGSAADTPDD